MAGAGGGILLPPDGAGGSGGAIPDDIELDDGRLGSAGGIFRPAPFVRGGGSARPAGGVLKLGTRVGRAGGPVGLGGGGGARGYIVSF